MRWFAETGRPKGVVVTTEPALHALGDLETPEDRDFDEVHEEREDHRRRKRGSDDDEGQRCHGDPSIRQRRRDQQIDRR